MRIWYHEGMKLVRRRRERGQVALVVILVVIVITVVVLSVASRSVSEVRVTTTEEDAAGALRLAEAGVEEALRTLSSSEFSSSAGEGSFSVRSNYTGASGFVSAAPIVDGDVLEVVLGGGGSSPASLDIYWSDRDDPEQSGTALSAIEVAVYNLMSGVTSVRHYAFDPDDNRRTNTTMMTAPESNPGVYEGVNYAAKANVPLNSWDTQLRIRVIYGRASLAVRPLPVGTVIATQQFRVVASGTVADRTTRSVEVVRNNPMLPSMFDMTVYSGGVLSK